ncbi:hypothetical protein Taro_018550 [Colocasia esculenta]|uniref:Uncharacterized protein n=1 Tax=Colocasia esculenta TaxID=4460 RepID=A0A843UZH3_COLES|nr:hypothetical protein [Colocasia esculenta]
MQMKSFWEAIGTFAEPSAIAGRERVEGVYVHYNMRLRVKHLTQDPKQRGEVEYDPVDIGFLRDEEDPMVSWVARATIERGEYELDEEADDPDDPPRPNTFLARAVAEATIEEEGDRGNVGQPYSPHYEMDPEAEVDLLGDIELELHERRGGGGHGDDDDDFESWGSKKGKKAATIVEDPLDIADAETLDPNAEDETLSPLDSPRLPNSSSHDSMTTGGSSSDAGGDGGGNGGGGGGDGGQGGGDGDDDQGEGGGGMEFTEEQFYRGATQDSSHGAPMWYNRMQKFRPGSQARGSPVDSHSYDTMISDFERMSTQESVGSYGGHSCHPKSTSTDYSSGYGPYSGYTATTGYLGPSPYMYPPPAFSVHVPVQVFAPVEDVCELIRGSQKEELKTL